MSLQNKLRKLDKQKSLSAPSKVQDSKDAIIHSLWWASHDSEEKPTTAYDKLSDWQEVGYQWNRIYVQLTWTWWYIPVQAYGWEQATGNDQEKINAEISAIQKFDVNSPWVSKMFWGAIQRIDDAIDTWIIKKDLNDPAFVEFCIVVANEFMHELHPFQNEAANKTVIESAHANNKSDSITELTQAQIDANNAQVCKDFAPTLHLILRHYDIWSTLFITEEKDHMNLECDIPGKWITLINAKQNTQALLESDGGQAAQLRKEKEKLMAA